MIGNFRHNLHIISIRSDMAITLVVCDVFLKVQETPCRKQGFEKANLYYPVAAKHIGKADLLGAYMMSTIHHDAQVNYETNLPPPTPFIMP